MCQSLFRKVTPSVCSPSNDTAMTTEKSQRRSDEPVMKETWIQGSTPDPQMSILAQT